MTSIINGKFGIQLFVRDLNQAAEWYCSHLGFTLGPHNFNDFVELHLNGQHVIHLFKHEEAAPLQRASFNLDTDDILHAYHCLKEKGVTVSELIHFSDHSGFHFSDIEGNVIGITHFSG